MPKKETDMRKKMRILPCVAVVSLVVVAGSCAGNGQSPTGPTAPLTPSSDKAAVVDAGVAPSSPGHTRHLPITDFVERQGNIIFTWWDPATDNGLTFDHYGARAAALGLGLPTRIDGDVAIRTLVDGRALVSVTVHTKDALCFGWQGAEPALGYNGVQVRDGVGPASLGEGLYREVFTMPSPDTPLPSPADWASGDFTDRRFSIVISCTGILRAGSGFPEGTPGFGRTTQQALLDVGAPGHCPAGDCWPAEKVFFRPIGGE